LLINLKGVVMSGEIARDDEHGINPARVIFIGVVMSGAHPAS
jgi:hypothetical protein